MRATKKSLYGIRDAAQNWECEHGGFLEEIGLRRGQVSAENQRFGSMVMMYEIREQMIGEAADLDKQLQILNRTVRWSSRGLWIEADPRHVGEVIKASGASPAPTPVVVAKGEG